MQQAFLLYAAMCGLSLSPLKALEAKPETEEAYQERMQWFTDAQFGLFIHYGVYSTLGGEWQGKPVQKYAEWIQRWGAIKTDEYIPLAANFRPDKLDADLWVKTAKEAGMKYMVITAKHHEGFCLWDSELTEYDLGDTNDFDRDILGELKAACDKYGLKFGTYYSILDWHHPTQRIEQAGFQSPMSDKAAYTAYMKGQLKELIERYDPAIMWFDADWVRWWQEEDGTDLYNYLRELSPKMIINNRYSKRGPTVKDFGTPENSTPGAALDHIWEACWTVNHSWGYKKSDTRWKSAEQLIQKQIDINTKGGNLLLNVGPYGDGSWPEASTELLLQMGEWNQKHTEAVYETDYLAAIPQKWGRLAQSKTADVESGEIFAYIFDWPTDGMLKIRGVTAAEVDATTYDGKSLPVTVGSEDLELDLSSATEHPNATVLRLKYSGGLKTKEITNELELTGNELILQAGTAELSGSALTLKENTVLAGWSAPSDVATWDFNVPAPGKYTAVIRYSLESKRKVIGDLKVGDKALKGRFEPTPSVEEFNLIDLGEMNLNEVGDTKCSIKFSKIGADTQLNVQTIYFVPVSD
ncbi:MULTISPECIES: alpha-L-fucosidase [unclassified Lentimonas]|uniref:alpha-L-fucosidase n=1 Tax=unclassified Lentimonas TaxID=2630993 RepID=UPI00132703B3|nr:MULTISPECIES: alpha-L-fucosidase [unclassified Lentimonas]CAA6691712.1 Alpha-L-fucosidase (EC [Lentimonas sp. CC19]CAA6696056.1 Alpha-L-fucosidase (EC [Lentimonas sp. CC10]CAA7070066.1 Alpha-L-fucosidase (EC [Lentimonas sp. CC11]